MNDFIKKYKQIYYSIKSTSCFSLGCQKVYLNNNGFNHLIRKRGVPRSSKEQKRRLKLIKYVERVLSFGCLTEFKRTKIGSKIIRFWSIKLLIKDKSVFVILRKINNGKIHFYSIFDRQNKTPR